MKKISYFLVSLLAVAMTMTGCKDEPKDDPADGGKVKSSDLIEAICDFYSTWEEERAIPATVTVGSQELSIAGFAYAEAAELVSLASGKAIDIDVPSLRMASNPDRDSYDQSEIAVKNGPKDGKGVAEDLVTLANSFLSATTSKGQIPNQTLVYRGSSDSDAIAFCTNRMIVTVARAISAYAEANAFPEKVSTEYLSASNTLKAFAVEFVKYLDIWENTVAEKLSADGSHCTANNNAWEMVHFVPIPYDTPNDYKNEGKDQYDFAKYGNPQNIEVNGVTYTAANCWEIAIRGLMDMCTTDGQAFLNTMDRNTPINYGDGLSLMSAPISRPSEACVWGKYPWYESAADGGFVKYNGETLTEVGIDFILKCCSWHVTRSFIANAYNSPLGMIGNYQQFSSSSSHLNMDGCEGLISPMREFLILARVYKYLLDNNITKGVYTAIKDVKFDADLYNQQLPVALDKTSLSFACAGESLELKVTAMTDWTATTEASWLTIDKTSGTAGESVVKITAPAYTEAVERTATVNFTAGNYIKPVSVKQEAYIAPTTGTLKAFAQEFVKALDVWTATVGRVDADGAHNKSTGWENVHLIPIDNANATYVGTGYEGNQYDRTAFPTPFEITVDGVTYTSAQCWEIAQRGMLDLVTVEGSAELSKFTSRNHPMTLGNGKALTEPMPSYTSGCKWGANPWYEQDDQMKYNGEAVKSVGLDFMVKVGAWHVIRSFVDIAGVNSPALGTIGNFQQFAASGNYLILDGYVGLIAPMRELLILARFYKHLLDNNIDTNVYDAVKDVKFDYDLYGESIPKDPTIKDFATEYVKLLGIWQNTTGDVTIHETVDPYTGVHYIPADSKISVAGTEYSISDCFEIAMRSFMLLSGKDGYSETVKGANKFPAVTPATLSAKMPQAHSYSINYWYMETTGNGGPIRYNNEPNKVTPEIVLNYCERNVNYGLTSLGGGGAWANVAGYNNNSNFPNHPEFTGCLVCGRVQMAFLNVFKYMLDNNKTSFSATDLPVIDCTLWGDGIHD